MAFFTTATATAVWWLCLLLCIPQAGGFGFWVAPSPAMPSTLVLQRLPLVFSPSTTCYWHRQRHNNLRLKSTTTKTTVFVSGGFSFDDGEQILVSVQKPLGILLEQDDDDTVNDDDQTATTTTRNEPPPPVVVAEMGPIGVAALAGVQVGDILVAVQNASVEEQPLEHVMERLQQAPRVVNLRFVRVLR